MGSFWGSKMVKFWVKNRELGKVPVSPGPQGPGYSGVQKGPILGERWEAKRVKIRELRRGDRGGFGGIVGVKQWGHKW